MENYPSDKPLYYVALKSGDNILGYVTDTNHGPNKVRIWNPVSIRPNIVSPDAGYILTDFLFMTEKDKKSFVIETKEILFKVEANSKCIAGYKSFMADSDEANDVIDNHMKLLCEALDEVENKKKETPSDNNVVPISFSKKTD